MNWSSAISPPRNFSASLSKSSNSRSRIGMMCPGTFSNTSGLSSEPCLPLRFAPAAGGAETGSIVGKYQKPVGIPAFLSAGRAQVLTERLYLWTASAANTAIRPMHQANAAHTSLPAGASTNRARVASTIVLNGLFSAKASIADGIDSGGTNADDANVSGKISMKPSAWAPSAEVELRAMYAKIQEKA